MPFAVGARGARVHYRVVGERGDWVVLLQGLGLSSRFWFEQPELLAEDPTHPRRVLVIDNRGAGKSDRPRPPYRMRQMADDVIAAMDAANVRRAVIVGISMGGMIAQHVALRHPNRVDGLVLLATTPGLPHGRLPALSALATLVSLPLLLPRGGSNLLAKILLPAAQLVNAAELMREWPAALKEERMPPLAFLGQLSAAMLHSTGFRLKKIDVPVVVVGAEQDVLLPASNSRRLASLIPRAYLEILTDAAHGIPLTDRDVVKRALEKLRNLDGASSRTAGPSARRAASSVGRSSEEAAE
jgi:3-oxoadipate enol-lactonase